jgi:hypothetical protein
MAACYKCGKIITVGLEEPLGTELVCEQCSSWLHCCANCAAYDEYSNVKCREPKAEFVFDRLGKNVCPLFKLRQSSPLAAQQQKKLSPRAEQKDRENRARDNLDRLFRS